MSAGTSAGTSGGKPAGTSAGTPAGKPAGDAARDPFFDNAKLLAMVLVVTGHAWQPLKDSQAVWAGYLFVYTFHMPVFILLAGYFSRSFRFTPRQVKRLIGGVLVPYVVFETVYTLYGNAVDDRGNDISLITPWYLTWFLIALFVWRLTAPVWLAVRWYYALGLSLLIALLGTYAEVGAVLNLDRVLQFLPFFVIGLLMRPAHWDLLRSARARAVAVPVLAGAAVTAYWAHGRMTTEWAVRSKSWDQLGVSWPTGLAMSVALLVCSLALSAAFLACVPRRRTWFTVLGAGTLCAYLLHGLIIRTAAWEGWYERPFWHTPVGQLVVTALAVALALTLTSPPVRRLFRPVMEPRLDWAFHSERRHRPAGEEEPRPRPRPRGDGEPQPDGKPQPDRESRPRRDPEPDSARADRSGAAGAASQDGPADGPQAAPGAAPEDGNAPATQDRVDTGARRDRPAAGTPVRERP
ncbi:acyltransferase family protein [Streptomyces lycii]|uniref:Acyltransferase family protein n=1 Tax=Streptomyces lycii TaxID=2654337 RepID=A0ABQ7FKY0_9ACTN|nr:acyltransferase family protein [Streptomyces lycii]